MKSLLIALLSFSVFLGISIITPTPGYGIPWQELLFQGVQIVQLSNISPSQEVKLGSQINQELLKGDVQLYERTDINRYVRSIGNSLVKASQRSNIPYTFQVIDNPSINAFATMGGFVYVHTGLIAAADNEAELASVIAHEIGHIVGRHSLQQMQQKAVASGLLKVAGVQDSTLVRLGMEVAVNLPKSRQAELEADTLGLNNLESAGYAPIAMITFMEKLLAQRQSIPTIISTHPDTKERIVALNQQIDPTIADMGKGLNERTYQNRISTLKESNISK